MDQNQRPHSRKKTVGTGSAGVGRGRRVSSGHGPVGTGTGRTGGSSARGSGTAAYRAGGKKLSLKTILIIGAIIIAILFISKSLGGGSLLSGLGENNGIAHVTGDNYSYSDSSYSSYSKPDYTVSKLARAKRVTPLGGGKDTVTVMVYMCGTDLESKYGMATKDLQEMLSANISDKVNLIVETGGCSKWKNSTISSTKNQIYKIENGKLRILQKDAGTAAMTDPKNLTSFINFCEKNYPADRNMLIFWDHGGGSLSGYGYDEKKPSASSMTLTKMNSALKSAGCTFDFIGFDACLMATLETALVCNSYADYLIASEETEPGTGWYYKNWLTELSKNTSTSTVDIAQTIIDDYISSTSSSGTGVTLSLVDLAEMEGTIPETFRDFSASTTELIKSDDYKQVSDARAGVRQFSAQSKINQVDLADLADRIGTDEAKDLAKALHGCVKYNKSTMTRCSGISIFFPYETTSNVKNAVASYEDLGIDDEYTDCIKSFASLEYGGQIAASASQIPDLSSIGGDLLGTLIQSYTGTSTSTSPVNVLLGSFLGGATGSSASSSSSGAGSLLGSLLGGATSSASGNGLDLGTIVNLLGAFSGKSMPAEYDWVDTQLIADNAKAIAKNCIDPARLAPTQKDGKNVLELDNDEWGLIQTVELNVFVKDGDGYIDMGLDNTFDWFDDSSLLLDYDGTWLTLNGNACAYYLESDIENADGSYTTTGRIPALLNGEFVYLRVVFDDNNPDGAVTGAYPMYEDDSVDVQAKGDIEIKAGDRIELLCDYYNLDGSFSDSYSLGTTFTVPQSGLKLTNLKLDVNEVSAMYRITDIYGNSFWIPVE